MKKNKFWLIAFVVIFLSNLACGSWNESSESEWAIYDTEQANTLEARDKTLNEHENLSPTVNFFVEDSEPSTPEQSVPIPEPDNQSGELQGSEAEIINGGINEYSVSAQDFNCICLVDGNVNVELRVNGDQLEVINSKGDVKVYDNIGENTFRRSWMGYYILMIDGEETKIDQEQSVVITLNDNGYSMEHYQGAESSPCCIHTFTEEN